VLIVKLEGDFMAIRSVEYLQSLVRELAKLPDETEWVEFKCNNKQPQMIGEYISALSNSAALCERPKAYLVWGVDDATHKIVGTEFQYRKMKKGNDWKHGFQGCFRQGLISGFLKFRWMKVMLC
jgi:hypothetical protein